MSVALFAYLCGAMFKILTFIVLGYLLYRLVLNPNTLASPETKKPLEQEPDSDDFTDYEEID